MKRCHLKNCKARHTVASVWRQLRKYHKTDARCLARIVKRIAPLSPNSAEDGTEGKWTGEPFSTYEEMLAFRTHVSSQHGQGYGSMELRDSDELSAHIVGHEFGHAFSSEDDLYERNAPSEEWASEAAADMHAMRWGLLTRDEIHRRYSDNLAAIEGLNSTHDCGLAHHGPPPGGGWFEIYGQCYRLTDDFVFETASKR